MMQKKISFITKNINMVDKEKKEHICKILLTYNVNLVQSNNGVFCYYSDLNIDVINIIYNYLIKAFEK